MRNKPVSIRLTSLLFIFAIGFPGILLARDNLKEVQALLEKMHRATHTLNYVGTFVYGQGSQLSSVQLIHRTSKFGEQQRMVAMDGTGREVIRDGSRVMCIMPDSKAVVVSEVRPDKQFPPVFLINLNKLTPFYTFSKTGAGRVAGRKVQIVSITPKDEFRYGHRLWIDDETGLLLKTNLLNTENKPVEQFMFTRIEYLNSIADQLLAPANDGKDYTWYESGDKQKTVDRKMNSMHVSWLPPGFKHDMNKIQKLPDTAMPVEHMVFSDGLASVSVFIEEELQHDPSNLVGNSNLGAVNVHGRVLGDYHVTVMGEVPRQTVQKISVSVDYSQEND